MNVKIILYGITIYTSYVFSVSQPPTHLLAAVLCNTTVGILGTLTWAWAGGILQTYIRKYYVAFNVSTALILAWSAGSTIV